MTLLLLLGCREPGPAVLHRAATLPVHLVAVGDTGRGDAAQRAVADGIRAVCAADPCDAVLLLGDNFYPDGIDGPDDPDFERMFTEVYGGIDAPFYAVLGNHDHGRRGLNRRRALRQVFVKGRWHLPAPTWRLDLGPVRLLGFDTWSILLGHGLDEQVRLARAWTLDAPGPVIALGHHPVHSAGRHGEAGAYEGLPLLPWADGENILRFAQEGLCGRVDMYVSGHDHNRQWMPPSCGVEWVVSGAGSRAVPLVDRGRKPLWADDRTTGFLSLVVHEDRVVGRFHEADGRVVFERVVPVGSDRVSPPGR